MDDWTEWTDWVTETYDALDEKDLDAFVAHLTPGASIRYGNADPVAGRVAIRDAFAVLFERLGGTSHAIASQWKVDDAIIVEAIITFTRLDGSTIAIPAAMVWRLAEGERLATDGQFYLDSSPVFELAERIG
jgi:ketosteroid isomerase-like protein